MDSIIRVIRYLGNRLIIEIINSIDYKRASNRMSFYLLRSIRNLVLNDRNLSSKLSIPNYELDKVVWKRHEFGDYRRTDEERDEFLDKIIRSDRWIIEGAHYHNWVFISFQNADLIIFLDTPYAKRIFKIIKRFLFQKVGIEKANYTPTVKMFMKMFEWNAGFEKQSKPLILNMLRQDNIRSLILKDNRKIDEYLN